MRTAPKVIVIGSGPGGLACAMQLAYHAYDVTVFEKKSYVGRRTSQLRLDDVRFDCGPTFWNTPHIVEKTLERVLREHGGVHMGVGVKQVITQGKRAIGLQLETGERIQEADYIVMNLEGEALGIEYEFGALGV